MLLEYHMKRNIHTMTVSEFPYFENVTINRKLNREGILAVINHMVASGKSTVQQMNAFPHEISLFIVTFIIN